MNRKGDIYMKKLASALMKLSKVQFVLLGIQTLIAGTMIIGYYTGKIK